MPRYQQLAADLRAAIMAGTLSPARFPTEAELCRDHALSRFTVREALRRLEAEGLVSRRRGSGTTVRSDARAGGLRQRLSTVDDILQYARDTRIVFDPHGLKPLPPAIADEIDAGRDRLWLCYSGLRHSPGEGPAICYSEVYVSGSHADALAGLDPSAGLTFRQIEEATAVRIARVTQDIKAISADAALAAALSLKRRAACLRIIRTYADAAGRPHQIAINYHPGDRFSYSMHIDVPG